MTDVTNSPTQAPSRHGEAGFVVAVLVVALNMRLAITSLGAVLDRLGEAGISATTQGVLTSLPVLCFAVVGGSTMLAARRFGLERSLELALGLLTLGLVARALDGTITLVVGTAVACSGIALANVLIPAIVKERFPDRVGAMTGAYTASLSLGSALGAGVTVPIADLTGSWRGGLGAWAALAGIAAVVWAFHLGPRHTVSTSETRRTMWRQPRAWAVAVLFGTQSTYAYVMMSWLPSVYADAGIDERTAGMLLAFSVAIGVPFFMAAPIVAARVRQPGHVVAVLTAITVIGWLGLWAAPTHGAWLWAALIGAGGAVFPVTLSFFATRTRSADDTAALSSMAQAAGYLIAAAGPFVVGILHDATGSWGAPVVLMVFVGVVQFVVGYVVGRPVMIESSATS